MLDQVLASASNFVVIVIVARSLSAGGFGSFSVAFEVYILTVFIIRGLASDPLSTAHASDAPEQLRQAVSSAAVTTVVATCCLGLVVAGISFVVGDQLAPVLLALAIGLPGLALQDYFRYALIVQGNARAAFFNDLTWGLFQLPLLWVAISQESGATGLLAAWAVAGNAAAVLGLLQTRSGLGRLSQVRPWLRRHRKLWPYFLLDNVIFQASNLVLVVVISVAAGLAQVAGFRAAMTVYAPLAIVGRGIVGVSVPLLARRSHDPRAVKRSALVIAWLLGPMALAWATVTLFIPDHVGRAFLGDSWEIAEPLVFLAGITSAVGMFTVGTSVGLRALGAGREGLNARIVVSTLGLGCAAVGGLIDGAYGVFMALALSAPFQVATWWWLLSKATDQAVHRAGASNGQAEAST